jgi:hypothetical protein
MPINIPKAGLLVTAILVTAIATATTWTASVKPVMADRPSAPSGVAVSATDENTVDVIWSAHPDGAEDYRVAWKPDGENYRSRHNLEWNAYPTGANHSITGLEADTTCRVKVRARFQDGPASEWSSEATVTTPEAERVGQCHEWQEASADLVTMYPTVKDSAFVARLNRNRNAVCQFTRDSIPPTDCRFPPPPETTSPTPPKATPSAF